MVLNLLLVSGQKEASVCKTSHPGTHERLNLT